MNKSKKVLKKIIVTALLTAVLTVLGGVSLLLLPKYQPAAKSQYILACPLSGTCLYKCPSSNKWECLKKPVALPIDSCILTKGDSRMGLIFSKDTKVYVSENTQMRIRIRHKRTDNPLLNMYLLARKDLKTMIGRKGFKFTNPTVMSTI